MWERKSGGCVWRTSTSWDKSHWEVLILTPSFTSVASALLTTGIHWQVPPQKTSGTILQHPYAHWIVTYLYETMHELNSFWEREPTLWEKWTTIHFQFQKEKRATDMWSNLYQIFSSRASSIYFSELKIY